MQRKSNFIKMKKISLVLTTITVIGLLSFTGCKQKDTTPPKIFLSVTDPDSTILNAMYYIPSATADDNFDGAALTSKIVITHNIPMINEDPVTHSGETKQASENMNDYVVTYTVTDNAGLKTSKQLHVVVYNEFIKYATYYQVKKESNEYFSTDYDYTDGKTALLTPDKKTNWRFSFPKLSDISGLKIYGDVHINSNSMPTISIPKQEKSRIETNQTTQQNDTVLYVVQGLTDQCYFTDTINYKIVINYTLDKYKKATYTEFLSVPGAYISGQDTTYGKYWKPFSSTYIDNVTETYKKI